MTEQKKDPKKILPADQNITEREGKIKMWCRYRGRVCIMVTEKYTGKIRFIRRKTWYNMTDEEIEKYIW